MNEMQPSISCHALSLHASQYVGIYQLWYEGSYLASSAVTGAVRFTLQQPTQNSCDPTYNGCKNEFDDVNTLNYCQQAGPTNYPGNQYPCQFYENIGAQVRLKLHEILAIQFHAVHRTRLQGHGINVNLSALGR